MKRHAKWLVVGGVVLCGIVAGIFIASPQPPRYEGRSLDEWLNDLSSSNYKTQQMARAAIKEMGPAAIPYLTNSLAQRNALSLRIYRRNILPRTLVNWSHRFVKVQAPLTESRNAALALQSLGPEATNAIPSLMAAIRDPAPTVAMPAAAALGAIGSNAVPVIGERLSITNLAELPMLLQAVTIIGTNAATLAPKIAPLLAEDGGGVWGFAQMALARIGGAATPEVVKQLESTNQTVQLRALSTLSQIGVPALSATNAILPFTTNASAKIRLQARQALSATMPPKEIGAPVWLVGLKDPDVANVEISLRQLTIFPSNVRAYNHEIAALAGHPTNSIRQMASNALTAFHAWPTQ